MILKTIECDFVFLALTLLRFFEFQNWKIVSLNALKYQFFFRKCHTVWINHHISITVFSSVLPI